MLCITVPQYYVQLCAVYCAIVLCTTVCRVQLCNSTVNNCVACTSIPRYYVQLRAVYNCMTVLCTTACRVQLWQYYVCRVKLCDGTSCPALYNYASTMYHCVSRTTVLQHCVTVLCTTCGMYISVPCSTCVTVLFIIVCCVQRCDVGLI